MCSIEIENLTEEEDDKIFHQNQNIRGRCGEIFFDDDKLIYYCLFCRENFEKNSTFINHLYVTHLFLDPPVLQDDISQLADCAKTDDIEYDCGFLENKEILCKSEINDKEEFITTQNFEDDQISENESENNFCELNENEEFVIKQNIDDDEINENDFWEFNERAENECKLEIEIKTEEIKENQCRICFKTLSSQRSLKRHELVHTKSNIINKYTVSKGDDDKFHCNLCDSSYTRICSLKRHFKKHPSSTKYPKSNVINKYTFPKAEDGKFHCNLCSSSYRSLDSLRRHFSIHTGFKPAKCDICSKGFITKYNLKIHISRVHAGTKPYKCNHCPAAFADRSNFYNHERIHLGDKRYNCDYCDKAFIQSSEKKSHERMIHTKERPFQCEICGQKFFNGSRLNNHKRRHTNTKPYECEICDKRYYTKDLLKDHKISHSDEKPHTCDICPAKFPRRKSLVQHMKIHSNVKQYVCTICNKGFAQSSGFYSHMKSHYSANTK